MALQTRDPGLVKQNRDPASAVHHTARRVYAMCGTSYAQVGYIRLAVCCTARGERDKHLPRFQVLIFRPDSEVRAKQASKDDGDRLSLLRPARIGLQPGRFDAGDRNDLVVVASIAGDADGTQHLVVRIADQHAGWIRDQTPAARHPDCREENRILRRALHAGTRTPAETERAVSLADRNLVAEYPGVILALGADNVSAGVKHHDRLRHLLLIARGLQCDIDDGGSLSKRHRHFQILFYLKIFYVAPNRPTCASRRRRRRRF